MWNVHLSSSLPPLPPSLPTCKDEEDGDGGGASLRKLRFFPPSLPVEKEKKRKNKWVWCGREGGREGGRRTEQSSGKVAVRVRLRPQVLTEGGEEVREDGGLLGQDRPKVVLEGGREGGREGGEQTIVLLVHSPYALFQTSLNPLSFPPSPPTYLHDHSHQQGHKRHHRRETGWHCE